MVRRVEDIIPANHRSIRDVSVRAKSGSSKSEKTEVIETKKHTASESIEHGKHVHIDKIKSDNKEPISSHKVSFIHSEKPRRKSTGLRWLLLTVGVIVLFAGLGYIASVYFARATFTITPKNVSMEINNTFLAFDSTQNTIVASGTIPYSFITVRGVASSTVPATIGPAISTKAQGPITIYNSFGTQAQRLVAGTRFINSSGKVYRLTSSVVVPGLTSPSKTVVPGTVSTTLVADQPGDAYNITGADSVSDFKIMSFKGTPKYDSIYARLTAPIVGGMVGTQSIVSPSVMASSTTQIRANLTADLLQQIHATLPSGYVMYDSGYVSSFATSTVTSIDKTHSILTVQGSVSGMIFKTTDLISRLADPTAISAFGSLKYDTLGLESLSVNIINSAASTTSSLSTKTKNSTPTTAKPIISMKIKGTIKLIGVVPTAEITKKVLGKTSDEAEKVFKQYAPIIESVDGEVMPPWSKIPTNPDRVIFNVKTIK